MNQFESKLFFEKVREMNPSKCILRSYLKSKPYFQGLLCTYLDFYRFLTVSVFYWNETSKIQFRQFLYIVEPVFSNAILFHDYKKVPDF